MLFSGVIFGSITVYIRRYNRSEILLFKNPTGSQPRLESRITIPQRLSNPSRRSTRTEWQIAVKCIRPVRISIPTVDKYQHPHPVQENVGTEPVLQSPIHVPIYVVCIQESRLNPDMARLLVTIGSFKINQQDRDSDKKTRENAAAQTPGMASPRLSIHTP